MSSQPGIFAPLPNVPSTQQALWLLLQGADRGTLFDMSVTALGLLDDGFVLDDAMDPKGDEAEAAAIRLDGSSFVAVQRWVHDLGTFRGFGRPQQDDTFGRRHATNEEFAEAPVTAHVKRAAQESFDPPAFMVRRSMPWVTNGRLDLSEVHL